MEKPYVSIIIPSLNEENYIENALVSAKNQNYRGNYEIIVVDGMSTDNTVKIAKRYADKVVTIKKRCIAAGRNYGVKHASGDILVFLDADTTLPRNAIKEVVQAFNDRDVVGVTCKLLPDTEDFITRFLFNSFNLIPNISTRINKSVVTGAFCAYRKEGFKKVKGFDENIYFTEDIELAQKINRLGKIKYLNNITIETSARRIKIWGRLNSVMRYMFISYLYFTRKTIRHNYYKPIR